MDVKSGDTTSGIDTLPDVLTDTFVTSSHLSTTTPSCFVNVGFMYELSSSSVTLFLFPPVVVWEERPPWGFPVAAVAASLPFNILLSSMERSGVEMLLL